MSRYVKKTSIFPAGRHEVFQRLKKLSTLQKIAWPYATFTLIDGSRDMNWEPGESASFKFRLLAWADPLLVSIRSM